MQHTVDVAVALGLLLVFGVAVLVLLRQIFRSAKRAEPARQRPPLEEERPQDDAQCIAGPGCGKPATEPMPQLARSRGSVVRDLFSMPPSYRRVVDRAEEPVLCRSHAHLADSKMTEFVADQRSRLAAMYAQIAQRAATFEQEELPRMISESLTDQQKKEGRRIGSVVSPIRRTGTDDLRDVKPSE